MAINVRRPRTAGLPHEFPSGPQQISQNFKHVLALLADRLKQAENLGDVQDVPIARTNLSVPSSAEVQTGLDGKSDVGHLHVEADITNLDKYTQAEADALLAGKSNTGHTHVEADITNLDKYTQAQVDALLAGKSNTGHTHVESNITDLDKYTQAEVDVLVGRRALKGPSLPDILARLDIDPIGLTVGPRLALAEVNITNLDKYTQAQVDSLLATKSNTGHTHVEADITNLDKYTQAQVDSLLAGKSNTGHTHVEADITDLDKYTQAEVDVLIGRRALLGPSLQDTFSRLGIDPLGLTIGPRLTWDFPTEDVKFTDAGSVGGTVQAWIEVKVNGVVGYLRVNSTK